MRNLAASKSTQLAVLTFVLMNMGHPAAATVYSYNFTLDQSSQGSGGFEGFYLTNDATGSLSIPGGMTVYDGDTFNSTITLNSPLTVPAASTGNTVFTLSVEAPVNNNLDIVSSATLSFYNNGVQVIPSNLGVVASEYGGIDVYAYSNGGTPSFTFNEVVFSDTIDSIENGEDGPPVSSATLLSNYEPNAGILQPSPVPLPAAAWLLLSGLGSFRVFARKRRVV
jgi:hypothetical protein